MKSNWLIWIFLLLAATPASAVEPDAALLASWMTGSFSSAAQAAEDSAYYDIRLEMAPIWTDRDDAVWLYVEQAVAGMTDRPYRQRVYRVSQAESGVFESAVFTLPEPETQVGAWRDPEPLKNLAPEDLELREGCTVFLKHDGKGSFVGGTEGNGCLSGLRGAVYATSEVIVGPGRIESWDRGFDAEGSQVWGAEKGAYVFLRDTETPD
jgi:CpeT protein